MADRYAHGQRLAWLGSCNAALLRGPAACAGQRRHRAARARSCLRLGDRRGPRRPYSHPSWWGDHALGGVHGGEPRRWWSHRSDRPSVARPSVRDAAV